MSDILFIYPNPSEESPQRNPALSIFFPGAACEAAGYDVEYWDERFDSYKDMWEKVLNARRIGISTMTGVQLKNALKLARLYKLFKPDAPLIWGGVHPTLLPKQTLDHSFVDCLIQGEGEKQIVELLRCLDDGKKWPSNRPNKPLNLSSEYISPITSKTLSYFGATAPILPTSRGCPYDCAFCCVPQLYKRCWRPVPFEQWAIDVERILEINRPQIWEFNDENALRIDHILPYLKYLKKRGIQGHCHMRADFFRVKDSARRLRDAGCRWVHIGVESGDRRVLRLMNKKEEPWDFTRVAERLHDVGIGATFTFILGVPTETRKERENTFRLAERLYKIMHGDCRMTFYPWMPLPGSALYTLGVKEGLFREPKTLEDWQSWEPLTDDECRRIYLTAGLAFNSGKHGKTRKNFPGLWRLLILPFEILAKIRFKARKFEGCDMLWAQKLIRWRAGHVSR